MRNNVRRAWSVSGLGILGANLVLTASWGLASTLHVRTDGNDSADGSSWSSAVRRVTRALALASSGDEIWVAAGIYTNSVTLKSGVGLYGGFAGQETARGERDRLAHETILDGGGTNLVVLVEGGGSETVIDGFTIQHGAGCGVRLFDSGAVISQNRIRWNKSSSALAYGAGISVKNLSPNLIAIIRDNVILENYAFDGGGIACIDASPQILGNTIAWNTAVQNGGGISCWRDASPQIARNLIYGNTASWILDDNAVPVGGGGIFATADDLDGRPHPTARSSPLIQNNVITANGAAHGGGIVLIDANGGLPIVLNNTVVANNGSGILWGSSALVPIAPVMINNLIAFNPWGLEQIAGTPTNAVIENNCVFGNRLYTKGADYRGLPDRTGHDGNISQDPQLASVRFGNLHLQPSSPCRNAGKDTGPTLSTEDVDGELRVQDAVVDIGADESSGVPWNVVPRVIRVRPTGDDLNDGTTWLSAKRTLAAALDAIRPTGGEVWVASGTYAGHFWLPAFVHLYGGFEGTETVRTDRSPFIHRTLLDGGGKPNVVISGQGGFAVSTLDGFTITGGGVYTGGTNYNKYGLGGKGGGILAAVSSPVITNNVITRNSLAYDNTTNQFPSYGAGIACELSYALIGGNTIEENEILNDFDGSGAGVYCLKSMPLIIGNRIARNQARYGAAIYTEMSTAIIAGNTVENNGMYVLMPLFFGAVDGAITLRLAEDALVEGNRISGNVAGTGAGLSFYAYRAGEVRNNLFVGNQAYDPTAYGGLGGGLYVMVTTNATSAIRIVNNTMVGNVASNLFLEMGGGLAFTLVPPATNLVIANNLIVSNSSGLFQTLTTPMPKPHLSHNNVFNIRSNYIYCAPGPSDVSRPPQFADVAAGDYRLTALSPDLDAAEAEYAPVADLTGMARPLDGNADGLAGADLGAFEFVHPTADTDQDHLPDWWEVAMQLDPVNADADADADGDGASNEKEYVAGTDPRQSQSVLALRVQVKAGSRVQLSWFGVLGRTYAVERASRLGEAADWQVQPAAITGTGAELSFEAASGPETASFFRVSVVSP